MLFKYCKHWKEKGHKTKQVILFFFFHLRSILLNILISLRKKIQHFFLSYSLKYRLLIYISVSHFSSVRGMTLVLFIF